MEKLPFTADTVTGLGKIITRASWVVETRALRQINAENFAATVAIEAFQHHGTYRLKDVTPENWSVIYQMCDAFKVDPDRVEARGYNWEMSVSALSAPNAPDEYGHAEGVDVSAELIHKVRDALLNDVQARTEINRAVNQLRAFKIGSYIMGAVSVPAVLGMGYLGFWPNDFCEMASDAGVNEAWRGAAVGLCLAGPIPHVTITSLLTAGPAAMLATTLKEYATRLGYDRVNKHVPALVYGEWQKLALPHAITPVYIESAYYDLSQLLKKEDGSVPGVLSRERRVSLERARQVMVEQYINRATSPDPITGETGPGFVLEAISKNPALAGTSIRLRATPGESKIEHAPSRPVTPLYPWPERLFRRVFGG
jgi:hypothetical protein